MCTPVYLGGGLLSQGGVQTCRALAPDLLRQCFKAIQLVKPLTCFYYEKDMCLLRKMRAVREERELKCPGSTLSPGWPLSRPVDPGGASSLAFTRSEGSLSVQCSSGGTRWGARGARLPWTELALLRSSRGPGSCSRDREGGLGGATWGRQVLKGDVAPPGMRWPSPQLRPPTGRPSM